VTDPLFWLVLSFLFVTVCLTIALIVIIPTMREVARAARSAEKLFETLRREFPPTLEAIRLTGLEITDLTDDLSEGVQSAGNVVKQVDQTLTDARQQAKKVGINTRSIVKGIGAAWKTLTQHPSSAPSQISPAKRPAEQPSPTKRSLPPAQPEQINGSRFIATSHTVVEQVEPYPSEEFPLDAAKNISQDSANQGNPN
jgi:uncharacterized protein YoxC